jgi:antitoxin component YwqK of YwqJK toxin-antitoxin module
MKNTILILISLLFLTGVSEGKEVSSLQDRGGVKYEINSEKPFTGRLVKKYENGQKGEEGFWTYWDEEGNVTKTERYKDGELVK